MREQHSAQHLVFGELFGFRLNHQNGFEVPATTMSRLEACSCS